MENIVNLFSSLGVPVACLVACFWLWNKERDEHKNEMAQITTALNNNTKVMERIATILHMESDIN